MSRNLSRIEPFSKHVGTLPILPLRSQSSAKAAGRRVLVVEDEWFLADDYQRALRDMGFEVCGPVASAQEAMAIFAGKDISFALLDIELLDGNSYAVADQLMERGIPFVFISGYDQAHLPPRMDGQTVLTKPMTEARFRRAVADLLC